MAETWIIVARSFGAIAILFLLTRILGKKQISQLTFFEYITGIALGELAGLLSTDLEAHYVHGIAALLVWAAVPFTIEYITMKSKKARDLLEGKGTVFIQHGKILENNLRKERYSADELMEQLRKKDVFRAADVEFAILEPTGDMSVLLKPQYRTVTAEDLQRPLTPEREPIVVIMDGQLLEQTLAKRGFTVSWLQRELERLGVKQDEVFLGQLDGSNKLSVDLFDDSRAVPGKKPEPAQLKALGRCLSELETLVQSAPSAEAKQLYKRCREQLQQQYASAKKRSADGGPQ